MIAVSGPRFCPVQFVCGSVPCLRSGKWQEVGRALHQSSLNRAGKEGTRRALPVGRQKPPFREAATDGFRSCSPPSHFVYVPLDSSVRQQLGQNPLADASLHPLTSLAAMLRDILRPFFFGL